MTTLEGDFCEPCSYRGHRVRANHVIGIDYTPVCAFHAEHSFTTPRPQWEPTVPLAERGDLFQAGDFTLASGKKSNFKVECDNLSDDELAVLARLLAQHVPPFRSVWGVPTGGLRLAQFLQPYRHDKAEIVLLVDDVWTTGGSMYRFAPTVTHDPGPQHGAVLFARAQTPMWVTALFTMPEPRTNPYVP